MSPATSSRHCPACVVFALQPTTPSASEVCFPQSDVSSRDLPKGEQKPERQWRRLWDRSGLQSDCSAYCDKLQLRQVPLPLPPLSPLGCKLNSFLVFNLRNQEEKASTAQRSLLEADLEELPCLILVVVDSFSWKFRNHSGKWACLIFGKDISWSAHIADVGCFTLLSLTQEYASFYQTHSPIWRESTPAPS